MAEESIGGIEFDSDEVQRFMDDIIRNSNDIKEKNKEVIGILSSAVYRDVMEHFDRSQGSEGPWPKWSRRYTSFMEKIGKGGNKILIDSGRLRNTFQPFNVRKTNDGLMWFNNAKTASGFPYAAAHNEGGSKLPKRDFMWLSDRGVESIEEQILRYLEK